MLAGESAGAGAVSAHVVMSKRRAVHCDCDRNPLMLGDAQELGAVSALCDAERGLPGMQGHGRARGAFGAAAGY